MENYDKIKIWDESVCEKHVINLISGIFNILGKNEIKEISYIDIGANVGKVYDLLKERVKINKVWMFEASPILFNYTKEKYSEDNNVEIYNYAINNNENIVHFDESSMVHQFNNHTDEYNLGLSKIMTTNNSVEIPSMMISNFIIKNLSKMDNLMFIKIDTETVDFNILEDILNVLNLFKKKPIIEFEVNYFINSGLDANGAQKILDKFIDFGYHKLELKNCFGDGVLIPANMII